MTPTLKANSLEAGAGIRKMVYSRASSLKGWTTPTPKIILTSQCKQGFLSRGIGKQNEEIRGRGYGCAGSVIAGPDMDL